MILDERYEIKTVLKQADGYTLYHARHLRLEKTVWIQELDAGTEMADQAQQRARAWSDCSAVEGMVHICDQFGMNGKVYIIYEAPTGQRLSEYLGEKGTLPETELAGILMKLCKIFSPARSIGLDDLPVTVEKLYRQEDGTLSFFACVTEYGQKTDYVYELCEIFYEGVTKKKPPQKQIRILFDEMESLSDCQPRLDGALAAIIEKGLQVDPEKSFDSLSELEMALANWEGQQGKKKRGIPYRIAGCFLCAVLLGIGLLGLYQRYEEQIRFFGVETQLVLLVPNENMTRKEYLEAIDMLKEQIGQVSGRAPCLVQDQEGTIRVLMEKKVYESSIAGEAFFDPAFRVIAEVDVDWMNRISKKLKHWVGADAVADPSVVWEYTMEAYSKKEHTAEEKQYHNIVTVANRLEALEIPYAIGLIGESGDQIAVKVSQKDQSEWIADVLLARMQTDIHTTGTATEATPREQAFLDEVAATWVENNYVHSGSYYYSDGELVAENISE